MQSIIQRSEAQTSEEMVKQSKPFGKIRNFVWPIHNFELKKLVPMFVLFFLISFVYNILRNLKIALFVGGDSSFAELMPFLKIGAVLPGALLFTYIFTVLISRFTRDQVFYTIISGFMVYFALFLFVLYPHNDALQLNTVADFLQTNVFPGAGFKGIIAAIRYLNLTVFYVMSEMWSVIVLTVLFWGFANEVTKLDEAKRFYAIFALGGNASGILSGSFGKIEGISLIPVFSFYKNNEWIFLQLCTVLTIGLVVMYLFYLLNKKVLHAENTKFSASVLKKSQSLSLRECFAHLKKSRYLAYMVVIVVCYNIVYNLADSMLMYKIQQVHETSREVNAYMSSITLITGLVAVVLALLVSGNTIRRFGWTIAALITPIVWFLTSMGFLSGLVLEKTVLFDVLSTFISNPANLVLFMGSLQMCLGRGCKYTVFDEAKEIAFIPLPKDSKRKGKAVVDGLASRFGKSGGAVICIMLYAVLGGIENSIPYVAALTFIVLVFWLYVTYKMGKIVDRAMSSGITLTLEEEHALSRKPSGKVVEATQTTAVPQT